MKIIKNGIETQIEIERSKFITYFYHVKSLEEAKEYQNQLRKEHPQAAHHCLAMVVDDLHYAHDDGEPSNTAGFPMLQTLLGNEINEVAAIVVRYFGGTLLGRGGLIRAYGSAVSHGLDHQEFYVYQEVKIVKVTISYDLMSIIETKIEPKAFITRRDYSEKMIFHLDVIDDSILDELVEMTNNQIHIEVIKTEKRLIPES